MKHYSEEEFLNQLLSIPSVNGVDDEREIANFIAEYLKDCKVNVSVREIDQRHANVVAVLGGKSKEKVVWNGHLDTVPYGKLSQWNTDPAVPAKKNGCIYARGASDMKSGLAAMVYALGNMKQRGYIPEKTIYFLGTCDEEKGGLGAKEAVKEGIMDDAVLLLVGEPTGMKIGSAQKGCVWLKMKTKGKTSHGAYPQEGINAVEYGFEIFRKLKEKLSEFVHPLLGQPTVQITGIKGGIVPNMTPDDAEFMLDIRTVPQVSTGEILRYALCLSQTYERNTDGMLKTEFTVENERMAIETAPDDLWLRKTEWVERCMYLSASQTGINYFTDASILAEGKKDLPVILLGPGEPFLAHKPDKYVELKKYLQFIEFLNKLF